jgi:uncharacterized membrane protein
MTYGIPPIPPWDALHPLVVHFPLALLFTAPVLVLVAGITHCGRKAFAGSALIIMVIGTIAAYVATSTGDAAADIANPPLRMGDLIHDHEEAADLTRNLFTGLTIAYAILFGVAMAMKDRFKRSWWVIAHVVFLLAYAWPALVLANTGHMGGRIVHEFGVRAQYKAPTPGQIAPRHDADD